jgi:hypothetical protein
MRKKSIGVDLKAIRSIDHECTGCSDVTKTCCARYDVTVDGSRLQKIIPYLPDVAELCPHLRTAEGYANVFEEAEDGLFSIDTHENDLCVFAYRKDGLIRCSLHAVEDKAGLSRGTLKPEVCILWPLTFSDKGDLTLHDDALGCACSSPRKEPSNKISPALLETIKHFGGETGEQPQNPKAKAI